MHSFQVYNKETALCYRQLNIGSSRKAWLLTTTFGYFPFLFPSKKGEEEQENELAKFVIKSDAFLLDLNTYLSILWHDNWEPPIVKIYLKPIKEMQIVYFF